MTEYFYNDFDHDSLPKNEGGQLDGGDAWYRKTFKLDEEDLNKNVCITLMGLWTFRSIQWPASWSLSVVSNQFSYDTLTIPNKDLSQKCRRSPLINKLSSR